jgi:hypothetical protein
VKKTVTMAIIAFALVASGCAEADSVAGEIAASKPVAETTTTTPPAPPTTTTTSTTPAPAPTTTVVESGELTEVDALLASIKTDAELTSARTEGTISVTGLEGQENGPSEVTLFFSTAFDASTGDSSMLMDTSSVISGLPEDAEDPMAELGAAMLGEMEFRQIGERAYVRAEFFNMMFGSETKWISMPADDGAEFSTGLESAPTDPHEVLSTYEGAAATVEELGVEPVNGTTATHYRISVDATGFMDELSAEERAEVEASGLLAIGVLPIDLWITDEGYLVRMILEIDGTGAASPEGEFESMKLAFDMYDSNRPVVIDAPPAGEVTAVEDLDIGSFGAGLTADDLSS